MSSVVTDPYLAWLDAIAERVNFREDDAKGWVWECGDPVSRDRLAKAREAADEVGVPFDDLLAAAHRNGRACCDCEVLFNCDPREDDEDDE